MKQKTTFIIETVADAFNVTRADIEGPDISEKYRIPRFVAYEMLGRHTKLKSKGIGRLVGLRSHSTVSRGRKNLPSLLSKHSLMGKVRIISSDIERRIAEHETAMRQSVRAKREAKA